MSATRTRRTSIHLTRRGRILVVLGLVALLYAAFSLGRAASQASTAEARPDHVAPLRFAEVTVEPGESLWRLAHRIAPRSDAREVVRELKDINGLTGADLRVGQRLRLPVPA